MLIRHPNGVEVEGEVLDVSPPERIVFTYGWASGKPIPPDGSRVTIQLEAVGRSTRLSLTHEFAETAVRDEHVQGWRFQLSVFANVVADEIHADAEARVDAWFAVWQETDATRREALLAGLATPNVQFRDRYSLLEGIEDLVAHIGAAQRFMPGMAPTRRGAVRQCQGTALADWVASGPDGAVRATGTNVFVFDPDGRVREVTGFWSLPGA